MTSFRERDDQPLRSTPAKRFTTAEKMNVVLRLLKGESVEALSTELGVPIHRLERWQNDFVTGGSAELAKRKRFGSGDWFSKHAAAIFQWVALLIVLAVLTGLLELFLQRRGGE